MAGKLILQEGYESRYAFCTSTCKCGECVEFEVYSKEEKQSKPANTYNGVASKQYRRNARNRKASRV